METKGKKTFQIQVIQISNKPYGMVPSTKKLELLHRVLLDVQEDEIINDLQLKEIYSYLFLGGHPHLDGLSTALQDGVRFLRALIQEDGLSSVDKIWRYLKSQKRKTIFSLDQALDTLDRERFCEDLQHFLFFASIRLPKTKRSQIDLTKCDNVLRFLSNDKIIPYSHNEPYQQSCSRYFRRFTDDHRDNQMYILEYFSFDGIEKCSVGEVVNKLIIAHSEIDHICPKGSINSNNFVTFDYDRLLDNVSDNHVDSDFTFKVGVTAWLVLSEMIRPDLFFENLQFLIGSIEFQPGCQQDFFTHDAFEHWVYSFFVGSLSDKKWSILKTPHHHSWVTSDKPGFIVGRGDDNPLVSRNILKHVKGISSLYYPLSKDYCLKIETPNKKTSKTKNWAIDFQLVSEEEVRTVNELTVCMGKEMVIASDKKMLEALKPDP